jgi:hypothetical protein
MTAVGADATPVKTGDVENTELPVPVSSVSEFNNSADAILANAVP